MCSVREVPLLDESYPEGCHSNGYPDALPFRCLIRTAKLTQGSLTNERTLLMLMHCKSKQYQVYIVSDLQVSLPQASVGSSGDARYREAANSTSKNLQFKLHLD